MAEVTAASPVPICTGENLYGVHGFRELLTRYGTGIASPYIAKTGGLAHRRRIADLAASYGVLMAPHDIGSPVQAVAAGHLACSLHNLLAMEQHFPDLPLWHQLVDDHQLIAMASWWFPTGQAWASAWTTPWCAATRGTNRDSSLRRGDTAPHSTECARRA